MTGNLQEDEKEKRAVRKEAGKKRGKIYRCWKKDNEFMLCTKEMRKGRQNSVQLGGGLFLAERKLENPSTGCDFTPASLLVNPSLLLCVTTYTLSTLCVSASVRFPFFSPPANFDSSLLILLLKIHFRSSRRSYRERRKLLRKLRSERSDNF